MRQLRYGVSTYLNLADEVINILITWDIAWVKRNPMAVLLVLFQGGLVILFFDVVVLS